MITHYCYYTAQRTKRADKGAAAEGDNYAALNLISVTKHCMQSKPNRIGGRQSESLLQIDPTYRYMYISYIALRAQ